MAYNASGILWGRLFAGFGYRSHPLSSNDVDNQFAAHLQGGNAGDALVFKVRQALPSPFSDDGQWNSTLPALDVKRVGLFHEGLLAVSADRVSYTEVGTNDQGGLSVLAHWDRTRALNGRDVYPSEFLEQAQGGYEESGFQYAGTYPQRQVENAVAGVLPADRRQAYHLVPRAQGTDVVAYDTFSNNCQDHVARVLAAIRQR